MDSLPDGLPGIVLGVDHFFRTGQYFRRNLLQSHNDAVLIPNNVISPANRNLSNPDGRACGHSYGAISPNLAALVASYPTRAYFNPCRILPARSSSSNQT